MYAASVQPARALKGTTRGVRELPTGGRRRPGTGRGNGALAATTGSEPVSRLTRGR
jgi:hypothetical protein